MAIAALKPEQDSRKRVLRWMAKMQVTLEMNVRRASQTMSPMSKQYLATNTLKLSECYCIIIKSILIPKPTGFHE